MSSASDSDEEVYVFISPYVPMNVGLWFLFAGATIFLALRLYVRYTKKAFWYDDYILILSWVVLLANDSLIVHEFASGYVLPDSSYKWSEHMRLLITISSCGTLIGQAWTKTAFGVTLIRMADKWQQYVLWFCIVTMNIYMVIKVVLQWGKVCGDDDYEERFRIDVCLDKVLRDNLKEGGNVYNILMDFIFASFPWLIVRKLRIDRRQKIGLCITMSLGMIVAIVSAIRVAWKDKGNDRDAMYIYRNGLSQVWYSSEITGTIIVQCIPILRPIVQEMHNSRASRRAGYTARGGTYICEEAHGIAAKRMSTMTDSTSNHFNAFDKQQGTVVALRALPEERSGPRESGAPWRAQTVDEHRSRAVDAWLHSDSEEADTNMSPRTRRWRMENLPYSPTSTEGFDIEAGPMQSLSVSRSGHREQR